jgi:CheY-like chemotaxis protein
MSMQRQQQRRKPQKEMSSQKRNKKRILPVDDEPDHCTIYQIVLQDAGYECTSYTDPIKALQEFKSHI